LQKVASEMGEDVKQLAKTNLTKIFKTTEFLEKRLLREVNQKYEKEINEYDLISDYLYPNIGLQERIWNPLFLLNDYVFDVFIRVTETYLSFKIDNIVYYLLIYFYKYLYVMFNLNLLY